jgi:hypothetical protein
MSSPFNIELKKRPLKHKQDIKSLSLSDTQKPALIPSVKDPTLSYSSRARVRGRGALNPAEYNLAEIDRVADVDSYVARAFNKKLALMFKEGWTLTGKNPKTIQYIKLRLAQIARASKKPTNMLFRDLCNSLIRKSNSFLVKKRDLRASGGRIRREPNSSKELFPVAGYFTVPAETMYFELNGGRIVKWTQRMPTGDEVSFSPSDVIHFVFDKKDGFTFGTPSLIPVIDDVRALRKIEENIELLIYQHLFPLFQWIIGTENRPAGFTENGEREVDVVRREVQYLPSEGGIVTTERHKINAIGAEGRALRAEGYLTHFKRRVFAGLGMSPIDFGESDTSNRSTAETLSQNLIDSVKDIQDVFESFVNNEIINELLLESTFGPESLDEESVVQLKFHEVDLTLQIKKEAHYADQFQKDVITHEEARIGIGHEPILFPSPEEIDESADTPEKFPEWNKLKWVLFERPKLLIQSLDEPYTQYSKARLGVEAARQQELAARAPVVRNSVEEDFSTFKTRDSLLREHYKVSGSGVLDYLADAEDIDINFVAKLIEASIMSVSDKMHVRQMREFRRGYELHKSAIGESFILSSLSARHELLKRNTKYLNKLGKDLSSALKKHLNPVSDLQTKLNLTSSIFDVYRYRMDFIEDVEFQKAFNYGQCRALVDSGVFEVALVGKADGCRTCKDFSDKSIEIRHVDIDTVPPYHAKCACELKPPSRVEQTLPLLNSQEDIEELEDETKLERCVMKVKASLRKRFPGWSAEKIKTSAFKICNSRLK